MHLHNALHTQQPPPNCKKVDNEKTMTQRYNTTTYYFLITNCSFGATQLIFPGSQGYSQPNNCSVFCVGGGRSPWRVCPASMWLWPSFGIGKVEGWPECLEYPIVQIFLADLVAVPPKIICMFFMWPFIFENVMAIPPQTCWNIIDILSDLAFLQS